MNNYYGYIYVTIDQKENKVYVGQKKGDPEKSLSYFGSGTIIKRIIKSRGTYFLKKIILGYCYSREEILQQETECKYFFNSLNRLYGYNIAVNDNGGDLISNHPEFEEIKNKISKTLTGIKHSEERKKIKKEKRLGKPGPNTGKLFSDEHCKKLSIKKLGNTNHKGSKSNYENMILKYGKDEADKRMKQATDKQRLTWEKKRQEKIDDKTRTQK